MIPVVKGMLQGLIIIGLGALWVVCCGKPEHHQYAATCYFPNGHTETYEADHISVADGVTTVQDWGTRSAPIEISVPCIVRLVR